MASSKSKYDLSGKVVVITGASSGIGEATAILMAQRGASVTLCGRDIPRLEAAQKKCEKASGGHSDRFLTVCGDLTDAKYRDQIVDKTIKKFGKLNILVCNAGAVNFAAVFGVATEALFDEIMAINLKSVFFLIQTAAPQLEKSKGVIVTVSSIGSTLAASPFHIYSLAKVGVDHMTRCLAVELAPKGIRVNTVNPGRVATRLLRSPADVDGEKLHQATINMDIENQILESRFATPEECAEMVAFFASDASSFTTGQAIPVDGGRHLMGAIMFKPSEGQ